MPIEVPLAISQDGAQMLMDILNTDPTLYIDEIQAHLEAMTGVLHPASTIKAELRARLQLTKKVARTVNPAQCPIARAAFSAQVGHIPSNYLVFIGKFLYFHDCSPPDDVANLKLILQMSVPCPSAHTHVTGLGRLGVAELVVSINLWPANVSACCQRFRLMGWCQSLLRKAR